MYPKHMFHLEVRNIPLSLQTNNWKKKWTTRITYVSSFGHLMSLDVDRNTARLMVALLISTMSWWTQHRNTITEVSFFLHLSKYNTFITHHPNLVLILFATLSDFGIISSASSPEHICSAWVYITPYSFCRRSL